MLRHAHAKREANSGRPPTSMIAVERGKGGHNGCHETKHVMIDGDRPSLDVFEILRYATHALRQHFNRGVHARQMRQKLRRAGARAPGNTPRHVVNTDSLRLYCFNGVLGCVDDEKKKKVIDVECVVQSVILSIKANERCAHGIIAMRTPTQLCVVVVASFVCTSFKDVRRASIHNVHDAREEGHGQIFGAGLMLVW